MFPHPRHELPPCNPGSGCAFVCNHCLGAALLIRLISRSTGATILCGKLPLQLRWGQAYLIGANHFGSIIAVDFILLCFTRDFFTANGFCIGAFVLRWRYVGDAGAVISTCPAPPTATNIRERGALRVAFNGVAVTCCLLVVCPTLSLVVVFFFLICKRFFRWTRQWVAGSGFAGGSLAWFCRWRWHLSQKRADFGPFSL